MENKELLGQFNLVERRDGSKCIIVGGKLVDTKNGGLMCDVLDYNKETLTKKYGHDVCDIMKITTIEGEVLYERIDWEKIEKDEKVLVSHDGLTWYRAHFYGYKEADSKTPFRTYREGKSSWTDSGVYLGAWEFCKLSE